MKKKSFSSKLSLNKQTISKLNNHEIKNAFGGKVPASLAVGYTGTLPENGYCILPDPGECGQGTTINDSIACSDGCYTFDSF